MRIAAMAAMLALASGSTPFCKPAEAGDRTATSNNLDSNRGRNTSGGGFNSTQFGSRWNIMTGSWGSGSLSPGSDGRSACICSGGGWGTGSSREGEGHPW